MIIHFLFFDDLKTKQNVFLIFKLFLKEEILE